MTWLGELNAFKIFHKCFKANYNHHANAIPANIYLFKINNRNIRKRCEICSKLTIKPPERHHWRNSVFFFLSTLNKFHNFFECFYRWLRYHCGKIANVWPLLWRDLEESVRCTKWLHTLWKSCRKQLNSNIFPQKWYSSKVAGENVSYLDTIS